MWVSLQCRGRRRRPFQQRDGALVREHRAVACAGAEAAPSARSQALAAGPPKEVLLSQLAGLLKSPVQRVAAVVAALAAKKGEGAAAAA